MKKHLLYCIGVFIFSTTILLSCYDDKGNYDYHELEEIHIDTVGTDVQAKYAIMRGDTLRIAPNIYFEGELVTDESAVPLDYMWTIYSAIAGSGADQVIDTIGCHAMLNTAITRKGGSYQVRLAVTNRNDGIRYFFSTEVTVSEIFDGGWMVFYERADMPGYSDLALIYNEWVKSNSKTNRIYDNLYSRNNGEPLPGNPIRCLDIAVSLTSGNNYIGLCTDQTLVGVSENGFERALEFGDFFYQQPSIEAPTWYGQHGGGAVSGQSSEVVINNGNVYTNTYSFSATEGRTTKFGMPKRSEEDVVGELAPWNAEVPHTLNYGIVVYDQTNQCFRYAPYNSSRLERFAPQDNAEYGTDMLNNTGMTMIMSDWGKGTSQSSSLLPHDYSIMKKGANYYLVVTNFSTSTPADNNICVGRYEMKTLNCRGINRATTMAASHVGNFIYYGSGNKVYSYAYDAGKNPKAKEIWAAEDTNEEVTCVRMMKYYHATVYGFGMVPNADNLVHIATWNEETQKGYVYQYMIDPASGDIKSGKCFDYTIPGKVKDMAWKFSMQ